jgi:hypothetical protein
MFDNMGLRPTSVSLLFFDLRYKKVLIMLDSKLHVNSYIERSGQSFSGTLRGEKNARRFG